MPVFKGKLLVIDDEDFVRDSVVGYLEDSLYEVIEADNGEDGLTAFREHKPEIVLCDLRMPKMDGLQVLQTIMEESPDTPFIVVSGAGVMADVVEALRLGASDYLVKPLADMAVLEHSVKRNLERLRLLKENQKYRSELENTNNKLQETLDLLEMDLQAGRRIQQLMLPENDKQLGSFKFCHHIIPSHYMSGDFVDYFEFGLDKTLFYIADVSGHGVSSAIVTMQIRDYLGRIPDDALGLTGFEEPSPSEILDGLNRHLLKIGLQRHATLFLGVIDEKALKMSYCCAAHFPTPIIITDSDAEALPTDGMPIGMFEAVELTSRELDLTDCKGVFLCSDGVLEILEYDNLVQKESGLLELITKGNNTIDKLFTALELNFVQEVPDDITLLTINRIS